MIQNTVSICNKHQKLLISLGYCSDCLFEELKEQNCRYMHSKMLNLIKNGYIEMQQEMNQINNNVTQSIEQLHDNVILLGQMKDGKKHGNFYYLFDDGTKEYAGIFKQNKKEGIWQEFVSFTYEVEEKYDRQIKKKRMKTLIYNQGNQLRYQQVKGQTNIYMEKIGLFNQLLFRGKLVNNQKMGYWQILYGSQICGGGSYNDNGKKIGQWTEVCEKYNNKLNVTYQGEYKNGIRIGKWKTLDKGNEIGGGQYDEKGIKSGQWIDVHDNYMNGCKVTYKGEYKNGIRIGIWKTLNNGQEISRCDKYNENGVKQGQQIDVDDNYQPQKDKSIGGGQYKQGVKQGQWIELHDNYYYWECQAIYQGEYKNGKRIGKWKTSDISKWNPHEGEEIGGGQYDENGVKSGLWVDLDDNYNYFHKVTYQGEYKNGIRIGKWTTLDTGIEIGYDNYDEKGVKSDQQIAIQDNYEQYRINQGGGQ